MRLSGKVAIVTGSASGLGRAMLMLMAREGAAAVVTDINVEGMEKVVKEIKDEGGVAIACKADVTNRSEVQNLMKTAVSEFGQIHILVNNAGIPRYRPFLEMTDEDWDAVIAVNVKGVYNCIQAVAPYMMQQRYGKIINITSIAALGVQPSLYGQARGNTSYAVSKAGVIVLTKYAARELGPYGINVNSIAPGTVLTPWKYATRTPEEVEKHMEERKARSVLGRVGQPEDTANMALFLASDESNFVTGQVMRVDGGRTDYML